MSGTLTDGELGWPAPPPDVHAALGWPAPREGSDTAPTGGDVSRETASGEGANVSRETGLAAADGAIAASRGPDQPLNSDSAHQAGSIVGAVGSVAAGVSPLDMPYDELVSRETPPIEDADGEPPIAAALLGRRSAPEPWPRPAQRTIYTVANQKGGVGKTTSTVNLASALAQHGARVLVIDLDPQGNASTAFGVDHHAGTPSVYDVLIHGRPIAEVAVGAPDIPGLDVVPATIDLAGAEIELVSVVARESRMRKALEALNTPYDYVFVDCPPSLGLLTVNALVAARQVLIPIQCEFYALEGLSQLLRNIELVRSHLNPALHVSTILLTMYDARTRLAEQVAAEVRNHFGDLVLGPAVPRSVRISEAPGYGQSVMTYDPASRGARAYAEAARELAERASRGQQ